MMMMIAVMVHRLDLEAVSVSHYRQGKRIESGCLDTDWRMTTRILLKVNLQCVPFSIQIQIHVFFFLKKKKKEKKQQQMH